MNGYFWRSEKYGNDAEKILFEKVKDNKASKRYISKTLSEFSKIQNQYIEKLDDNLLKHSLKINLDFFYKRVIESHLNEEEINYLKNAIHTRYMKRIRELKIPLNNSNPKKIFITK